MDAVGSRDRQVADCISLKADSGLLIMNPELKRSEKKFSLEPLKKYYNTTELN